jgi:hypothetical protein
VKKLLLAASLAAITAAPVAHAASGSSMEEQLRCRQIAQEGLRQSAERAKRAGMGFVWPATMLTNFNSVDKQCYVFTSGILDQRGNNTLFSSELSNAVTGEVIATSVNGTSRTGDRVDFCEIHNKPCTKGQWSSVIKADLEQD